MRNLLILTVSVALVGCAAVPIRHVDRLEHYSTTVRTGDGWELALFRFPPDAAAAGQPWFGTPVVLWHGTSVNRFNYITEGSNLAEHLAGRGFDVWIPEYRGDRTSRAPDSKTWRSGDWSPDDIVAHDVPAVLARVRVVSQRDQVWWVGHSLGGVLGYMALQGPEADVIAGLVTISSPGAWPWSHRLAERAQHSKALVPRSGQVPSRSLAKLLRPMVNMSPDAPLLHAIFNLDNVDERILAPFVKAGMENIGRGTVEQYLRWVDSGHLVSRDGTRDYTTGLADIHVPVLLLGGRIDHIVPPWAVRAAYDGLGSTDKEMTLLGVGWGQHHDYGHGDLLIGDWAGDEVFPLISAWMEARLGPAPAPTYGGD